MDKQPALSVCLAVYNEGANLRACLESVKDLATEIVIVDGESSDNTVSIAREYGATVISETNKKNFHINKQIAIDACNSPWILQLDADERVSSMLAKEIARIITADATTQPSAYSINRRNYFLGRWMNKGGMYPDSVIRLFQKGKARLPQKNIHELMEVDGMTGQLIEDLLHIADPIFSRYLMRSNRYTTLQAEEWLSEGSIPTSTLGVLTYLFVKPLIRFLSIYFRHKGFQDGFPGLVFAFYSGLHISSSYVKYFEMVSTKSKPSATADWK
jgi:glycosyltransferase involved in cell wall biosynthesis